MLQDVLARHQGGRSYFVDKKGRFNSDPVSPAFMDALKQDAEVTGAVEAGLFKHMDAYDKFHAENAGQVHELGFKKGYKFGNAESERAHGNQGFLKGLLAGWDDAATFKQPHRVYDTTPKRGVPIEKAIKPLASGADDGELSAALEDTKANRPWKIRTGATDTTSGRLLESYKTFTPAPFALIPGKNRLSLNQAAFRGADELIQGIEAKVSKQDVSRPTAVEMTRQQVLAKAMGVNLTARSEPRSIPKRDETALERGKREAAEQFRAANEAKQAAEEVKRKARKPKKVTEKAELPQVEEVVETPQVTPLKPARGSKSPPRVQVPAPVELTLSGPPSPKQKKSLDEQIDDSSKQAIIEVEHIDPNAPRPAGTTIDELINQAEAEAIAKAAKKAAKAAAKQTEVAATTHTSPGKKGKAQTKKAKRTTK